MSDDPTKQMPTEDKIDSLIDMVRGIASDLNDVKKRLAALETKVETRLHDTRPMHEALRVQIVELHDETRRGFLRLNNLFDKVAGGLARVEVEQADIQNRMDKLEEKVPLK